MRTRVRENKREVFCEWRRRYVRLTPEEWVRQQFLSVLESEYGYPHAFIGVEVAIDVAGLKKRCDAVVYNRALAPVMIIEFKAETVPLSQIVLDQAAVYNHRLNVPYLMLCNGKQTIVAQVYSDHNEYLNDIPRWNQLSN